MTKNKELRKFIADAFLEWKSDNYIPRFSALPSKPSFSMIMNRIMKKIKEYQTRIRSREMKEIKIYTHKEVIIEGTKFISSIDLSWVKSEDYKKLQIENEQLKKDKEVINDIIYAKGLILGSNVRD